MKPTKITPMAALTHPIWIAALALLVFNDHFLKAAELSPMLSGKLSDFAGLLVAPVLLAAVIGVKSRRGLWLSAAAVGTVFAAINVSPAIAASWDAAVSMLVPYRTTVDPTDLMALVMLPLGLVMFGPAMAEGITRSRKRRTAQYALAAIGVVMCTATSEDDSCSADSDCRQGDACVNEWCEPPQEACSTDADCPEAHLQCAEGFCSYRPTCSSDSQCASSTCEPDGRCDLAGVPVGGSNMSMSMMDDLEQQTMDSQSLEELRMRPIQVLDPVLLDYLHDDAMPVAR